jgi:hypothetical protein
MKTGIVLVFALLLLSTQIYASSARYLVLPAKTWEIGAGYTDGSYDDNDNGFYLILRYGITDRLNFIPFGLLYAPVLDATDQWAIFAHLRSFGYGSLQGFHYESRYGTIYRRFLTEELSLTARLDYGEIVAEFYESGYRKNADLALRMELTPSFAFGIGTAYRYEKNRFDPEDGSALLTTKTIQHTGGIFAEYSPRPDIDIRLTNDWVRYDEETDGWLQKEKTGNDIQTSCQAVWRF